MGGTNSETINNLRFHINNCEVHIHDDARSLKFVVKKDKFVSEVQDALDTFKSSDGIIEIEGSSKEKLCLIKNGKNFTTFIMSDNNVQTNLEKFIKSC